MPVLMEPDLGQLPQFLIEDSHDPCKDKTHPTTRNGNQLSDIAARDGGSVERYKLCVVGDSETGKTCLLNALVKSDFEVEDCSTFDECVTDVTSGDTQLEFMLWDGSGLELWDSLRQEMYRDTDVFLICFDIGNPDTLTSVVDKWVQEIKEACPGTPYLLIGCKNDLRTDSALQFHLAVPGQEMDEHLDSVSRIKATTIAQVIGARDYVECCAKTRWNIKQVFKEAADAILSKDESKETTKPNSMLRRFSRFARRHSGTDITLSSESNSEATSPRFRRISLFQLS